MNPIGKYAKLLESLKVNKDQGREEMHGWNFTDDPQKIWENNVAHNELQEFISYLLQRCRRAESRTIPETLAEDFKKIVLAAMDATRESELAFYGNWTDRSSYKEFRKLSEPGDKNGPQRRD